MPGVCSIFNLPLSYPLNCDCNCNCDQCLQQTQLYGYIHQEIPQWQRSIWHVYYSLDVQTQKLVHKVNAWIILSHCMGGGPLQAGEADDNSLQIQKKRPMSPKRPKKIFEFQNENLFMALETIGKMLSNKL